MKKKARDIESLNSQIRGLARTASSSLEEALRIVGSSPASKSEKKMVQRKLAEALDALQGVKGIKPSPPARETYEEWKERREERKSKRSERLKGMREQADV